jgi:hypothetical protein
VRGDVHAFVNTCREILERPQEKRGRPAMIADYSAPSESHRGRAAFLAYLRHEAAARPALKPRVDAYEALLQARLGEQAVHQAWRAPKAPLLTARYATPHGELAFFSMFTTFGTPQDITLASLRVEHMFAADDATRAVLAAQVS